MTNRKIAYSLLLILLLINLILAGIIFYSQSQKLKIIFLDVGQGDAILISQKNNQMLIDGGPDGKIIMEKLGKYLPFWDRKIEVLITTHPDQDHIAGLVSVMENYNIGEIIDNGVSSDSQVYARFKEIIQEKNINEMEGISRMKIKMGDEAEMEILYPDGTQEKSNPKDTNNESLIAKLIYSENSFLFTGDMEFDEENKLFSANSDLNAQVLKIAHHGSKYATSSDFLEKVSPEEAIISVGKNNRYGHPTLEVLERLKEKNIKILRTDEGGDINYECKSIKEKCLLNNF